MDKEESDALLIFCLLAMQLLLKKTQKEPTEARNMSRRALASLALYRLLTAVSSKGIELEGEIQIGVTDKHGE